MIGGPFEILIVDDLKSNLLALRGILSRDDVTIREALSGREALEHMMKQDFCVAIIDVNMPEMSGFELAELMRGSKKTKNVPIIFVTATATAQNFSFKGYESGAVDFLLKPLDAHAVKSKVNIFIELDRQKKELGHQLDTITRLLKDLSEAKNEAERANASKTEFLAHMSHEIRSPIGAILGFSDLLKEPDNSEEENREYMTVVERNCNQLLRLIDDILDLSKVEAGMMTVENMEFSLPELMADFTSAMRFRAREKGIEFELKTSGLVPDHIFSDPHRLRQILSNVVGNAIKFTSHGYVELTVSFASSTLKFTCKDTGIGISRAQESRLFQPFSQADKSTTRKFGGTGLGLVLSRLIAESLGGKLELLEGKENVGSTFVIEVNSRPLPYAKFIGEETITLGRRGRTAPKHRQVLRGLKVLLVEDSPDNQFLIKTFLDKEGAKVILASDGAEGMNLAMTSEFDVLLMDIQMPILDGHEATKKLRSSDYKKPIVALTAHAMKEERAKCIQSGFTEFLTKPIQRDSLIELLAQYVPATTEPESSTNYNSPSPN